MSRTEDSSSNYKITQISWNTKILSPENAYITKKKYK